MNKRQINNGNNNGRGTECPWLINLIRQPTFNCLLCVRVCVHARESECVWGWRSNRSQHCKMLLVDKRRRLQVSQNKRITTTETGKNLSLLFHRSSHASPHCVGVYLLTQACVLLFVCIHLEIGCFSPQQSLTIFVMPNTSFTGGYCCGGHCFTPLPVWTIHCHLPLNFYEVVGWGWLSCSFY